MLLIRILYTNHINNNNNFYLPFLNATSAVTVEMKKARHFYFFSVNLSLKFIIIMFHIWNRRRTRQTPHKNITKPINPYLVIINNLLAV